MRKGGDDETEGETKAEYERTVENEQGQEKKGQKKREGTSENRVEAGKADERKGAGYGGGNKSREWEVA